MKIVDRATFLALPPGTVFQKYAPVNFGEIAVKGDTLSGGNDFWNVAFETCVDFDDTGDLFDKCELAVKTGASLAMDLDIESRDGMFDEGQLFAVWGRSDVEALVARLGRALAEGYAT